jgi:hypothetical protein
MIVRLINFKQGQVGTGHKQDPVTPSIVMSEAVKWLSPLPASPIIAFAYQPPSTPHRLGHDRSHISETN